MALKSIPSQKRKLDGLDQNCIRFFKKPKQVPCLNFPSVSSELKNVQLLVYACVKFANHSEYIKLTVSTTNTIGKLRKYLSRKYEVHMRQIECSIRDRPLIDNQTFNSLGMGSSSYLQVNIRNLNDQDDLDDGYSAIYDTTTLVSMQLQKVKSNLICFKLEDHTQKDKVSTFEMKIPSHFTGSDFKNYVVESLKLSPSSVKITTEQGPLDHHKTIVETIQADEIVKLEPVTPAE